MLSALYGIAYTNYRFYEFVHKIKPCLPNALSGGQQQRVAIARAIITRPCVLLADEPTAGLDPVSAADVLALFDSLHESGHTIVLITHDPAAARRATRRLRLENGVLFNIQ